METLPEVLQQAAAKRLQYPDLSLTALCGCFDPAVSKSGLSHRMKKLEALAETLRSAWNRSEEAKHEEPSGKQPWAETLSTCISIRNTVCWMVPAASTS